MSRPITETLTIASNATNKIDVSDYGSGMIFTSATFNTVAMTFKVSDAIDGTFGTANDGLGLPSSDAIVTGATGKWIAIPDIVFKAQAMQIAATVANDSTIPVMLFKKNSAHWNL